MRLVFALAVGVLLWLSAISCAQSYKEASQLHAYSQCTSDLNEAVTRDIPALRKLAAKWEADFMSMQRYSESLRERLEQAQRDVVACETRGEVDE